MILSWKTSTMLFYTILGVPSMSHFKSQEIALEHPDEERAIGKTLNGEVRCEIVVVAVDSKLNDL